MESRYTVYNKISETIYGAIYKAHDNKMDCDVALKLSNAEQGLKRGEDPMGEIAILDELSNSSEEHEGKEYIIRLHDKFSTKLNDILYYCSALEFTEGGDLLGRILEMTNVRRQLSFLQIHRYFVMLAKGLSFIHKRGVSHLDLSLENILLTKDDEIRICDFGQSEKCQTIHDVDLRRGKPKYMSPEIYQLQKYDGFKADVWSLGVILWGLVTGGLIYKKSSYSDPRFAILAKGKEGIIKLLEVDEVQDVPELLIDLLTNMLTVDAKKRYTIQQVLAHPWVTSSLSSKSTVNVTADLTLTTLQLSGEDVIEEKASTPLSTSSPSNNVSSTSYTFPTPSSPKSTTSNTSSVPSPTTTSMPIPSSSSSLPTPLPTPLPPPAITTTTTTTTSSTTSSTTKCATITPSSRSSNTSPIKSSIFPKRFRVSWIK